MHLPKQLVESFATGPPTLVMNDSSTVFHYYPMGNPESENPTPITDVHPASCKATKIIAHDEEHLAKETMTDKPHGLVDAVNYKPTIYKKLEIREHIRIQSDATEQLTKTGKMKLTAESCLLTSFRR